MTRTVLVGLDGATFSVLEPLMGSGAMPFLAGVAKDGVRGTLRSTVPPVSPTAWTTLATGRSPGNHGVFDFIRAAERNDEVYFTLYNSRDIRSETLWSIASREGLRVTVLNFMLTFPAPAIDGNLIPGLVSWKHLRRGMRPTELFDRLQAEVGVDYRRMGWDFELEKKVLGGIGGDEYEDWIEFHLDRERQWFEAARHLMATDPTDLTAVVFDGIDKIQHACWRFLDPDLVAEPLAAWEERIKVRCVEYFRRLDSYMAELAELAGPGARLFFVSDHGFAPSREVFRVNVWLYDNGYLEWAEPEGPDPATSGSWQRRLDSNFALLDWTRTVAYARTPSSNGIFIRTSTGGGPGGVPPDRYHSLRQELAQRLLEVPSPLTGRPVVARVRLKEEVFAGTFEDEAPDLFLELADHGFVSIRPARDAVVVRPEVSGTHHPDGIFLATGSGIASGELAEGLSLTDVAPLLLHSLGLTVPRDMEGAVPPDLFDASWLGAHPVRTKSPADAVLGPDPGEDELDVDAELAIFERLRALGYVE